MLPLSSFAKTFVIKVFAEPGSEIAAQEFINQFKNQQPFKQLIEKKVHKLEVSPISNSGIRCGGESLGIPRLAKCELDSIKPTCGKSDLCPVYTKVPWIGAGGPKFPTVSSSFPWTTMFHEMFTLSDSLMSTHTPDPKFEIIVPAALPGTTATLATIDEELPKATYRPYFCPTVMGHSTLGEEFCFVQKHHDIIKNSPDLLPDTFESSPSETAAHIYGIPEVDRFTGEDGSLDLCR